MKIYIFSLHESIAKKYTKEVPKLSSEQYIEKNERSVA